MSDARPPTQVSLEPVRFSGARAAVAKFSALFAGAAAANASAGPAPASPLPVPFGAVALPLLFLSALKWRKVLPRRMAFERIAATFHGPFRMDDALELAVLVYPSLGGPGRMEVEFDVRVRETRAKVSSGSGVLGLTPPGLDGGELGFDPDAPLPEVRLPVKPLPAHAWRLEQIEKGQTAAFDLVPSLDALRALHDLVLAGGPTHAPGWHEWIEAIDPRPLLLAAQFATAAALLTPAGAAECTGLELELKTPPPLGEVCRIKCAVVGKSDAPASLTELLTLTDTELKLTFATGTVRVHTGPGTETSG